MRYICACGSCTAAVASLQSAGSTSRSCVPSLYILKLCFLTVFYCCVRWIKDFFILQMCNSVIRGLKEKGSKSIGLLPEGYYLLSVIQIKSHTWVSWCAGYYTSMEQKTVLTSDLKQVSKAKSMASNRGLWGNKGIILMEADKLCSHRLTSLYHRNGEAAKQTHFNQECRTTQGRGSRD